MMLVTATRPFHWGRVPAEPGRYYADTTNAGDALQPGYPWVHASDCAPPFPNDLANAIRYGREMRKVLLVRPGGIGDLLFLGVVARAIHGQWQACEVTACVAPPYMAAAAMIDGFNNLVAYPPEAMLVDTYTARDDSAVCWCENVVEFNEAADGFHIVDLYASRTGIEPADKSVRMTIPEPLREWAAKEIGGWRGGRPRIGIQVQASSPVRSYPHPLLIRTANLLHRQGCTVVFLGAPASIHVVEEKGIVNGTGRGWRLEESCAILSRLDAVIAPDSGLLHAAAALDVPTVGLYGSFDAALRTAHHPRHIAIQGQAPCAPCGHHSRGTNIFPSDCPGRVLRECHAMAAIRPEEIVEAVWRLVRGEDAAEEATEEMEAANV